MLIRAALAASLSFMMLVGTTACLAQSAVTQADINRAKKEIDLLKQDVQVKEAELRRLELQMSQQTDGPVAAAKPATKPVAAAKTPFATGTPALPGTEVPAPSIRRSNIDPSPYEAAITARVAVFRMSQSSLWRVLDEKRLVFWILDDEAYMLNLAQSCPGVLSAKRIHLENFSTKVRAGIDHVVFDDQGCLIESIYKLVGRSLPKPPKE